MSGILINNRLSRFPISLTFTVVSSSLLQAPVVLPQKSKLWESLIFCFRYPLIYVLEMQLILGYKLILMLSLVNVFVSILRTDSEELMILIL